MPISPLIQTSLFPIRESLQQVEQEAIAQLPITTPNQLIALLRLQQNTLQHIMRQQQ